MKYHIITYGCQMNVNDSERISTFLEEKNFQHSSLDDAHYIIVNSCSIRQSTIDRIEAKLKSIKKKTEKKIILTGCVLEKDKEKLSYFFDYYWPVQNTTSWLLPEFKKENKEFFKITPKRRSRTAYISIMTGCNNFCSYCVVPHTKGREFSRSKEDIVREVKEAVKNNAREIFLLGQNVNSYQGDISFPALLQEIDNIKGNFWIKFATSHPKDFNNAIIETIKKSKKITKHIHLPLQSGDDEILAKMNRHYTVSQYKNIINEIKKEIPNITITTDIIVGFPGETERNFHNTAKVFQEIKFDMAYIARYSKRSQTAAEKLNETVSNEEKKRREKILVEILSEIKLNKNKERLANTYTVLVLSENKKGLLIGKTEGSETVVIKGSKKLINNFVKVKITNFSSWGLKAKIIKK